MGSSLVRFDRSMHARSASSDTLSYAGSAGASARGITYTDVCHEELEKGVVGNAPRYEHTVGQVDERAERVVCGELAREQALFRARTHRLVATHALEPLQHVERLAVAALERLTVGLLQRLDQQTPVRAVLRRVTDNGRHGDLANLGVRVLEEREHLDIGRQRHVADDECKSKKVAYRISVEVVRRWSEEQRKRRPVERHVQAG